MNLFGTSASIITDLGLIFVLTSAVFALIARYFIWKKQPKKHMMCMITGVAFLWLFLIFYIINYLTSGIKTFGGPEDLKLFYYIFLIIHIIGSMIMGFLTTYLVYRSYKRYDSSEENEWKKFKFEKDYRKFHKRFGSYGVILWIFSAVSGLMVYIMLYVLYTPEKFILQ